jgi:hypothetical protein
MEYTYNEVRSRLPADPYCRVGEKEATCPTGSSPCSSATAY